MEETARLLDLFEVEGVGAILHSFRPVTPEDFHPELCRFLMGKRNGDNVRLFLKVGADLNHLVGGHTPLVRAICACNMEAFQMIVEDRGVDLEVRAGAAFEDSSRHVLAVMKGDTAVMAACRQGRWPMVPVLVAKGADVEARDAVGQHALQIACKVAETELRRSRMNPAAHHSAICKTLRCLVTKTSYLHGIRVYVDGLTRPLLHFFTWCGFADLVEVLLSKDIDVNTTDWGGSRALEIAVKRSNCKIVQLLINKGANVNVQVSGGFTVLHLAVFLRNVEIVKLLLEGGANKEIRDSEKKTPREKAEARGYHEIVALLDAPGTC
uniref:Uncharacterized protein n=1 Tax=Chromera velia CCMP2878 TaxID=1169474 RepID=A0A0G4GLM9_9ALVE|mmetsp:Transcript_38265/g.75170  ORF Transcript_38265/g.75170 Transcript_38265/m.75170 type:complete len:324 (-) Transcript_38265:130-1101(-)|eukprot:Cvel_22442.t1-p1 / transcript=Cvel_22442.t1 / gene=Cvel_22442 / organism=Chromera_velia_CCMP2878 / gene_product=Putative ankyrin repeat protein MM_0045, putative / transcript_product=Putative ankyrin repeat protein MM_0045, putative / location=Cvel_scaffold2205:12681-13649(-) / protein_length=323 / sequence_SO=supercontig / SO=protein_coding / is_pseudo=false